MPTRWLETFHSNQLPAGLGFRRKSSQLLPADIARVRSEQMLARSSSDQTVYASTQGPSGSPNSIAPIADASTTRVITIFADHPGRFARAAF